MKEVAKEEAEAGAPQTYKGDAPLNPAPWYTTYKHTQYYDFSKRPFLYLRILLNFARSMSLSARQKTKRKKTPTTTKGGKSRSEKRSANKTSHLPHAHTLPGSLPQGTASTRPGTSHGTLIAELDINNEAPCLRTSLRFLPLRATCVGPSLPLATGRGVPPHCPPTTSSSSSACSSFCTTTFAALAALSLT